MDFSIIKWDDACLKCQATHGGVCHDPRCAEQNYDPWGDPIPSWVYYPDGNCLKEYLAEKEAKMYEMYEDAPDPEFSSDKPSEIDISKVVEGARVTHKIFGAGTVARLDKGFIVISFDGTEKKFLFPDVFHQGFLIKACENYRFCMECEHLLECAEDDTAWMGGTLDEDRIVSFVATLIQTDDISEENETLFLKIFQNRICAEHGECTPDDMEWAKSALHNRRQVVEIISNRRIM